MSLQIKGKFIQLEAGEALKQKKADETVVELIKLDESISSGSQVRVAGEQVARKTDVDSEKTRAEAAEASLSADIASEASTRESADNALDARLDIIEGADTVEGSVAKAEKDAKDYADAAVLVEKNRAEAAEAALDARLDIIEGPETQAGSIAKALKDAKDYVNDVVGVSSAAVAAFASLAAQMTDGNAATGVIDALGSLDTRVDSAETAISTLQSDLAAEISNRISDVNAEETRALAAEAALQADIDAEETRALAAEAALDARLDTIEAKAHYKMKFTLSASDISNGYVQLAHEAVANSIVAAVGRLMIHQGASDDFTLSTVGEVTRITFVNSLVTPGQEKLAAGDVVFVKYMA